jgi:histidyl-tRNA synthetase
MLTQAPRGTYDVLPQDSGKWQFVESIMREVLSQHGMREIRTPVFEHTELFLRSVGDTSDIVQKEMYTFQDKGERSLTLKPEGTAGVVRSFIEHGMFNNPLPVGLYYINNPIFRYDTPQAGRMREHHQWGVEVFGSPSATIDAEIISIAAKVIERIGIRDVLPHINSIGCPKCRPAYQQALKAYFAPNLEHMCNDCKNRFERNPMRLIDCKDARCQPFKEGAPVMIDCLCDACRDHFELLKASLTRLGIEYTIDHRIVRGLDYYTRTVFEFVAPFGNGVTAIAAGGRYDGLVEEIGGPPLPAMGFGSGIERLLLVAQEQGVELTSPPLFDVMVLSMGEEARQEAFSLANGLREAGLRATCDHMNRSLKAQFKYAGKLKVPYCVILAPDEMSEGAVKLRNMAEGSEEKMPRADIIRALVYSINNQGDEA